MPRSPKDPRVFDKPDSTEADSVVLHNQQNALIFLAQVNAHRLCLRVPNHVGQALLEDSEGRSGPVTIQV